MRVLLLVGLFGLSFGLPSSKVQPRIVNGNNILIEAAPYQTAIEINGEQKCGGAIISNRAVLTSVLCLDGASESSLKVRVGTAKRLQEGDVVSVAKIQVHPQQNGKDFDLAILVLDSELTFDNKVKAVALPVANEELPRGEEGTVTGWGLNKEADIAGKPSENLQSAKLPIASQLACKAVYSNDFTESMFCAGGPIGGYGPCDGDWGAPLVVEDKLVGIASWANGCGRPNFPSVYQNVAKSIDFIQANL